jgi:hypothetical protein
VLKNWFTTFRNGFLKHTHPIFLKKYQFFETITIFLIKTHRIQRGLIGLASNHVFPSATSSTTSRDSGRIAPQWGVWPLLLPVIPSHNTVQPNPRCAYLPVRYWTCMATVRNQCQPAHKWTKTIPFETNVCRFERSRSEVLLHYKFIFFLIHVICFESSGEFIVQ